MSATKSMAFVLKKQDYRDTSLLVDFYTKDYGRVRGIVKGIRGARAQFGSTLEPFSLNEILFYRRRKGSDLQLVTQVELADLFVEARADLERLATASYCVELLSELVETEEPSQEIFMLLYETLKFIESGASCKRAARIFEIKLLMALGLMPEIKHCVYCGKEPKEAVYFHPGAGGIHCQDCGTASSARAAVKGSTAGMPVSRGTLNFIDHVSRQPVSSLYTVKVSQEVGEELERVLRRFTDYQLSHKLKSLQFMEKIGI